MVFKHLNQSNQISLNPDINGGTIGGILNLPKPGTPNMPLTHIKAKSAKPKTKQYKLADEKGLYLLVKPTGGKYWRLKYRFVGKERILALGVFPEVSLIEARDGREAARKLLRDGIDPSQHRKEANSSSGIEHQNSFKSVAQEWLVRRGEKSEGGDKRIKRLLEKDLYPAIGNRPIAQIKAPELLQALRRIEERGAIDTAHRAKGLSGMIFRYAIACGKADNDPSIPLKGSLRTPKRGHRAAILEPTAVGKVLTSIDLYQGSPEVRAALKLTPLLFCRPGELRQMEWSEVNFDEKRIEIPGTRMKMGKPHIIPLSTQAFAILNELKAIQNPSTYVSPSPRGHSRPLSDNAVRTALRTLGYTNDQICPHGFRATARTLLDEELGYPTDVVNHQLAHRVLDTNGRAYNRTSHLKQRTKMMQDWADYLDQLKAV